MDLDGWEYVLIEWVNCLQLSKSITDITDLKDGIFFNSFLQVLDQKKLLNDIDILTTIFETLKKEYPNFEFENESITHLEDLSKNDIIAVCSLLMHYSCVFKHKDVLTSPLCKMLSHHTQLCIRMFFEKTQSCITKECLFEIINDCISTSISRKKCQVSEWTSGGDSPLSSRSPLLDLLRTKSKKSQFQERDGEIKKLRQKLETEMYLKLDIQEELKKQQEYNNKIGKELIEKVAEIKKMRSELLALQYASPLKTNDHCSQELQQRLKGEIKNLEHYISQLQSENEVTQKERDQLIEKVKVIENEFNTMHGKCLTSEQLYESILEKYQNTECELKNLKQHCCELTALLEEHKNSKSSDSYIEPESFFVENKRRSLLSDSCETLASVVEVQLKDSLKENNELKNMLKATEEMNNLLQANLESSHTKIQELDKNVEILHNECEALKLKGELLCQTQKELEKVKVKLQETTTNVINLNSINNVLSEEVSTLKSNLDKTKILLCESESVKEDLTNNNNILDEKIKLLDKSLKEKHVSCTELEKINDDLKKQLKTSINNFNQLQDDFNKLWSQFTNFDNLVETYLQKLETMIYGGNQNNIDYQDKNLVFECIVNKIQFNIEKEMADKKKLCDNSIKLKELVNDLQKDCKKLQEEQVVSLQEKHDLSNKLIFAENKIEEMERLVLKYEEKIEDLNFNIEDMSLTIKELENLKNIIEEKQLVINENYQNIDQLNNELLLKEKDISELTLSVQILTDKKTTLNAEIEELQGSYLQCNNSRIELEKKLENLQEQKEQLHNQVVITQEKLSVSINNETSLIKELDDLKIESAELKNVIANLKFEIAQYEIVEMELKRTTDEVKIKKAEVESELTKTRAQLEKAEMEISKYRKLEKELKANLEKTLRSLMQKENLCTEFSNKEKQYLEEVICSQKVIQEYKDKISNLEDDLSESNNKIASFTSNLQNVLECKNKLEEEVQIKMQESNRKIDLLNTTVTKLEENSKVFSKKQNELQETLKKRQSIIENLEKEKVELKITQEKLIEEVNVLKSTLIEKSREYNSIENELKTELETMKSELINKNATIEELEDKVQSQEYATTQLQLLIKSETSRLDRYDSKIKELTKEIQIINDLKVATEEKYLNSQKISSTTIAELTESMDKLKEDLLEEIEDKEERTEELILLKEELKEKCEQYENLIEQKNSQVSQNEDQIEKYTEQIISLKAEHDEFITREIQYLDELKDLKYELNEVVTKYSETLENMQDLKMDNEAQINSLTVNLHNLVSKYNELVDTHQKKEEQCELLQTEMDSLKNDYDELLNKFSENDEFHRKEFERETIRLNSIFQESKIIEKEVQDKLSNLLNDFDELNANNKEVSNANEQLLAYLVRSNIENKELIENLNILKEMHQKVENDFENLKHTYELYMLETNKSTTELRSKYKNKIVEFERENDILKGKIAEQTAKVDSLLIEREKLETDYQTQFKEQNNEILKICFENESLQFNINKITEEIKILEDKLRTEEEKMSLLKITSEENIEEEKEKFEKLEDDIRKLKCANNILETGEQQLRIEMETLTKKIDDLENSKLLNDKKHQEEIFAKDQEILETKTLIKELEKSLFEKNKMVEKLKNDYNVLDEKSLQLTTLLENEKSLNSASKIELEKKILKLTQEQIQLYELITQQYELLKINFEDKYKFNTKLSKLFEIVCLGQCDNLSDSNRSELEKSETNTKTDQIDQISSTVQNILNNFNNLEALNERKIEIFTHIKDLNSKLEEIRNNEDDTTTYNQKAEEYVLKAHENTVKLVADISKMMRAEESIVLNVFQYELIEKMEVILEKEMKNKGILEKRVLDLTNEKFKMNQLVDSLRDNVTNLVSVIVNTTHETYTLPSGFAMDVNSLESLSYCIKQVEQRVISIVSEKQEIAEIQKKLLNEQQKHEEEYEKLALEKDSLDKEKEKLINDYHRLLDRYNQTEKELLKLNNVSDNLNQLRANYEEQNKDKELLVAQKLEMEERLTKLQTREAKFTNLAEKLKNSCNETRNKLENLIKQRNDLEVLSSNLLQSYNSLQNKMPIINESKTLREQQESLEILALDLHKQVEKLSKNIYKMAFNSLTEMEKSLNSEIEPRQLLQDFDEKMEEMNDLKDRAEEIKLKLADFEKSCDKFANTRALKPQKENVPYQKSSHFSTEDEYKKKNTSLKQKLTLAENGKACLEKKLKQLREEKKKLENNDVLYFALLKEHEKTKEEYERIINECNVQYDKLYEEYQSFKNQQKVVIKTEQKDNEFEEEYKRLLNEKCHLELQNEDLQMRLKEETSHLNNVDLLNKNYTKTLEENTKLKTELDTLEYKRKRDREEFVQILKKHKEEETLKIREINNKHETNLKILKQRMLHLYNDELQKESQKMHGEISENEQLTKLTQYLRTELDKANKKIFELEKSLRENNNLFGVDVDMRSSKESLHSIGSRRGFRESVTRFRDDRSECRSMQFQNENDTRLNAPLDDVFEVPDSRAIFKRKITEEKVYSSLPRGMGMDSIQGSMVSRKASVSSLQFPLAQSLEMEDEESDLFNNKYLTDLKEGRCTLPAGKESNVNRISELQWRNSLYPPHLKSSYPAETQFNSPSRFKEDDIKVGTAVELDDSLNAKLLPGEKGRKKDIGTTSYKRPGPPTPSKNGGRVSLQGNELQSKEVLRDQNDKTPKRSTPSRLRALFRGRNSISGRENSENQSGTPKSKRLSIFRRPR